MITAMAIDLPNVRAPQTTPASEADYERTAVIGRALADPKRLCVLESLAAGELSVSDLSMRVGCQIPNMSQHLAVLRSAGLVAFDTSADGAFLERMRDALERAAESIDSGSASRVLDAWVGLSKA